MCKMTTCSTGNNALYAWIYKYIYELRYRLGFLRNARGDHRGILHELTLVKKLIPPSLGFSFAYLAIAIAIYSEFIYVSSHLFNKTLRFMSKGLYTGCFSVLCRLEVLSTSKDDHRDVFYTYTLNINVYVETHYFVWILYSSGGGEERDAFV
jgi:hypothetical protein